MDRRKFYFLFFVVFNGKEEAMTNEIMRFGIDPAATRV